MIREDLRRLREMYGRCDEDGKGRLLGDLEIWKKANGDIKAFCDDHGVFPYPLVSYNFSCYGDPEC